jgi:hypothetical protein
VTSGPKWKPALNAFATTFGDRFPAAETYLTQPPETPLAPDPRRLDRVMWTSGRSYQGHLCSSNIEFAARS